MDAMTDTQQTPIDQRVARVARIMLAVRDQHQGDLADVLGLNSGALSRKMHGHRKWTLTELELMAQHFDVSVGVFFEEADDLVRSRCFRPEPQLPLEFNLAA
jgi:transcriptional regulator with XRE-family HTH domain